MTRLYSPRFLVVLSVLLIINLWGVTISQAGPWDIKLELENTYHEEDGWSSAVEPTLRYSSERWRTHLEYEKQFDPESEDGKLEWQYDYKFEFRRSELVLRNELTRDLDRKRTASELTPRWYYYATKAVQVGFDLEFDYFDSAADPEFDLFEIEIEPIVIWTKKLTKGKFIAELEAPVFRLYSKKEDTDDIEFEGSEAEFRYQRKLAKGTRFQFEFKLVYDRIKDELEYKPNLSVRYKF